MLTGVIAPLVSGLIVEQIGSYFQAFVVAVVVLVTAIPVYCLTVKEPTSYQTETHR